MQKLLTEVIGSMLFMFAISLAAVNGSPLAPLAIGAALMTMVYMGGHVSGGHYNPAVSLAVLIRGKMSGGEFVSYVIAQTIGSVIAFGLGFFASGKGVGIAPGVNVSVAQALIVEILFTMMLALVVLNVATTKKIDGNSFYGLAIGFTIVVAAISGGGISGGAFNPAVAIGAALVNAVAAKGSLASLWIYIVGPMIGGALGGAIYKIQHAGNLE